MFTNFLQRNNFFFNILTKILFFYFF